MSSFITQIRRDLADHRGTVFWTPMIIAGIMAALIIVAAIVGKLDLGGFTQWTTHNGVPSTSISIFGVDGLSAQRGPEGQLLFDDGTGPKPFHAYLDDETRNRVEQGYALTTGLLAIPLALLALITLPFAMSSTLYEERKDRSILFWKSMPVTDLTAVGSRMLSLPLGTIFWALVGAVGLHALLFCIGLPIVLGNGFLSGISLNLIGAVLQTWAVVALMAMIYVLWAAPVLAWFLLVSSAAPKAPFIIAVAPFVLIPLFGTVLDVDSSFMMDPLYRLIGAYVVQPMEGVAALLEEDMATQISAMLAPLATSFADWQLWAGLAVAAGLVFAASEVRRRRTL